MAKSIGSGIGKRLLSVLGVDCGKSDEIVGFTLRVYCDEIVAINVERHVDCGKLEEVLELIEKCNTEVK